jgi:hypothetical protein
MVVGEASRTDDGREDRIMPGVELLAVTSKVTYYAVLTATVCVAVAYVVFHLLADRAKRNGRA